jgi:hypothetical protein
MHPLWESIIVCLCRGSDTDRSQKFKKVLEFYKTKGIIGDLDDGPTQNPLSEEEVEAAILNLLPSKQFDLIITHNPSGEYTRHLRHEEVSKAVINLWYTGKISTHELWTFAYEDDNKKYYPRAIENTGLFQILSPEIWQRKYKLITEVYDFGKKSWEAETTPRVEAFWQFTDRVEAMKWLNNGGVLN